MNQLDDISTKKEQEREDFRKKAGLEILSSYAFEDNEVMACNMCGRIVLVQLMPDDMRKDEWYCHQTGEYHKFGECPDCGSDTTVLITEADGTQWGYCGVCEIG